MFGANVFDTIDTHPDGRQKAPNAKPPIKKFAHWLKNNVTLQLFYIIKSRVPLSGSKFRSAIAKAAWSTFNLCL